MSKPKNTKEQWIKLFNIKHSNLYNYSNLPEDFIGNDKIEIICNKHGNFSLKASNHRSGKGCPICSGFKKYSDDDFLEECRKVHNFKYSYPNIIKINKKEKIEIICPEHGSFFQQPYSHKNGNGCPKCKQTKSRKRIEDYISIFNDIHKNKYNYSKSIFNGVWEKIEIICPEHGSFFQSVGNHKNGAGCQKCSIEHFKLFPRGKKEQSQIIKNFIQTHNTKYNYSKVEYNHNKEKIEILCLEHGSFWQTPNSHQQGSGCPKCALSGISKPEMEINEIFGNIFSLNNRNIIPPKEIDLFSETFKFGIEYNGLMYHSFGLANNSIFNNFDKLDKNKHLNKTIKMEEKENQLFHILDIQWKDPVKKEIWKSIINNKIGNSYRLFARKLKIIDLTINKQFIKDFLNNNHLQGSCGYRYAFGLCNDKNEVYSIMTFGKSRYNKNYEYELLRFCNIKNISIIGGASKLLKYFERTIKPISIISYANRDWSQGNLYKQIGFEFIGTTPPNYFYVNDNGIFVSRLSAQKSKLKNLLNENFDEKISELSNMISNGYRIYFDTGNLKFVKYYKEN